MKRMALCAASMLLLGCLAGCSTTPQNSQKQDDPIIKEEISQPLGGSEALGNSEDSSALSAADKEKMFAPYEQYGMNYDAVKDELTYNGNLVRWFEDYYPIGNNETAGIDFLNENGTVDVYAVRDLESFSKAADGSVDPAGKLIGLKEFTQQEFDARDIEALKNSTSVAMAGTPLEDSEIAKLVAEYEAFGVTYDAEKDQWYFNGEEVRYFRDVLTSNGESLTSGKFRGEMRTLGSGVGTIDIYTVRDYSHLNSENHGTLTGIEKYSQEEFDEHTQAGISGNQPIGNASNPVAANHVRLMFEMYAEPETSFGDITRYFEEQGIKIYGKSLTRPFLSQLLRNPVYAQADLEMYEFFKSQGAVVVNDAADFAGTNGCYLYQGRDVKEDKDKSLKDQILVIAPHEGFVPSDIWLRCRKKLMTNITFQNGRKARNTWLAGKIKCGKCGYALKTTHNPSGYEYLRCSKRADHKGCPGCGTLRKNEFEQFIFTAMGEKFREFKLLRGGEEKANPKITAYQVELAQVEAEIEKLLDTLTGANATLLAYANKKIEDLDNRRKTLSKAIADLSVETLSSQQIELLSGYLDDWENISFEDKRKAADGLISSISATSDYVKIEWKI